MTVAQDNVSLPNESNEASTSSGPAPWLPVVEARLSPWGEALVLLLGALVFLPHLGSMGLWDPWETHYGEVAREMIARDDYLYPHWESAYFFSKPPLAMWLMAIGMLVVGSEAAPLGESLGLWTEWGVRLPFALLAIGTLMAVFKLGELVRDRTTGLLAALVLASSPQFIFIGKQTMVDMPLVAFMTMGIALFCYAVFDPSVAAQRFASAPRLTRLTAASVVLLITLPQFLIMLREVQGILYWGLVGAILLAILLSAMVAWGASSRVAFLTLFYGFVGLAALAKGPAAIYVLGPLPLFYMLFTGDFGVFIRGWMLPGVLVFALVAVPWFLILSLFEGRDDESKTFVDRFWIHDTLNRLNRGVHGDRPSIGYYIEQLAYGMWPWSALIPFSVGLAARVRGAVVGLQARNLLTFLLLWAVWGYVGFSLSRTGFHHYVFPAVPALALLVAYWIRWVSDAPDERLGYLTLIPVLAIALVALKDMINDPQHLSSLFTYKYDRVYPRAVRRDTVQFLNGLAVAMVVPIGFAVAGSMIFRLLKAKALYEEVISRANVASSSILYFLGLAALFGAFISHYHFNYLAQHWSQAHMFETYFEEKREGEPIYAYQLNWRGETFYSRNTIIQVKGSGANQRMRSLIDQPGREFVVLEQSRFNTFKNLLSSKKRDRVRVLDKSSVKFYLVMVD